MAPDGKTQAGKTARGTGVWNDRESRGVLWTHDAGAATHTERRDKDGPGRGGGELEGLTLNGIFQDEFPLFHPRRTGW